MSIDTAAPGARATGISFALTFLLAAGCGLTAANLYYSQPLAGPIGAALGLSPAATGLIVTLTQIGYVMGLLLIVPLADIVESRRLLIASILLSCLALACAAASTTYVAFLASCFVIGLGSVAAQIVVPYASYMAPDATRGRVVGNVMSGLMFGVMLARPVASFIAEFFSWRLVFVLSAIAMAGLAWTLRTVLPIRRPTSGLGYGRLLASMGGLITTTPILRRRSLYQALLFGTFSLFWTTVPLLLAGPIFHLSQAGIGLFALAGVAGAIAAPIAGRVADRGWIRPASIGAILTVAVAILLTRFTLDGSPFSLGLLTFAAILLDFGATANLTLGQRAIFALPADLRGRLNGLFIAALFIGGAIGSAVGGWAYATGGWPLSSAIGFAFPTLAFFYALTDRPGTRSFVREIAQSGPLPSPGISATRTPMKSVQRPGAPLTAADRLPISAYVICMNEADYIGSCLLSLKVCAEIVIVDSGSSDGTLEIVRAFIDDGWPIRLISQKWLGYAAQKQFALEQCTLPWCLSLDADERLDAALRAELPKLIAVSADIVGWRVSRRPYLIGYGYTPRFVRERKNLRLIRRGSGDYDLTQKVHEGIVPRGRVASSARGSLLHYRPLPLDEQILKENAYSTLKADQKIEEGRTSSFAKLVVSPPLYFIRLYVFNRLVFCGWPGFVQAATGAAYSFMTEAKILQRQARARQAPVDDMDGESL